jgi:hypothetical protein
MPDLHAAFRRILTPDARFGYIRSGSAIRTQVWEDQAVWNVDFCALFPQMRVGELYDPFRSIARVRDVPCRPTI